MLETRSLANRLSAPPVPELSPTSWSPVPPSLPHHTAPRPSPGLVFVPLVPSTNVGFVVVPKRKPPKLPSGGPPGMPQPSKVPGYTSIVVVAASADPADKARPAANPTPSANLLIASPSFLKVESQSNLELETVNR